MRLIRATCVIVLLALLVSYNLDLECLLESQSCQQTASVSAEFESSCSQPTTLTVVVVAILPPQTTFLPPTPLTVELVRSLKFEPEFAHVSYLLVPLGLRAPPAA